MSTASAVHADLRAVAADARPDAFVCYAREDKPVVEEIASGLVARGKNVWVDWEDIPFSASWEERALAGIEAAKAIVVVVSEHSAASAPCRWEVEQAVAANKRLVPIAIADDLDAGRLPPGLAERNWIPAAEGTLDRPLDALVETLDTDLEWRDEHARLLVRAVEWERLGRDGSLLLRGSDLRKAEEWIGRQGDHQERATPLQGEYIVASRRAAARRQRLTLTLVLVALAVAVALAAVALWQRDVAIDNERLAVENERRAVESARQARSRELAATAVAQLEGDPELALLLAIEAADVAPTSQAGEALRAALASAHASGGGSLRHDGLTDVAVSSDGTVAVTSSSDATARVWEVARARSTAVLLGHEAGAFAEGAEGVRDVALTGDGRLAATAGLDGTARTWDTRAGAAVATLTGHRGAVLAVALSPDGSRVATGGEDGTLRTWDAATGRELEAVSQSDSWTTTVAFSPDGSLVAAAGTDQEGAVIRDATTLEERVRLSAGHVSTLVFSPDRDTVVTASFDGAARAWDVATGATRAAVEGRGAGALALAPGGELVASAAANGVVTLWEVATGDVAAELRGHRGTVSAIAFSPDERYVATAGGDQTARVWDATTGRQVRELRGHRQPVWFVTFLPGDRVATAGADGTVRFWNALPAQAPSQLRGHSAAVNDVAVSPDGTRIATASADTTARLWNTATGKLVATLRGHEDGLTGTGFSPDGRLLVTAGYDGARVWDARTGELRSAVGGDIGWRAGFTRDSQHLITGAGEIWNLSSEKRAARVAGVPPDTLASLVLRPDGAAAFVARFDGPPGLYEVPSGRRVLVFRDLPETPVRAAFSPDGETLAVDDGTQIVLADARTGERTRQLPPNLGLAATDTFASAHAFDGDGSLLLVLGRSGVRVWDIERERAVADLPHPRGVGEAEFSPDGRLVLTAGWDGAARVWEARTGRLIERLPGRSSEVWSEGFTPVVAFAPHGWKIVAATGGRTAFLHECRLCAPLPDLLALARRTVTRSLSADERETYLGD